MMVIRGDLDQTERRALFDDNTLTGGATRVIFPADRCTWTYGTCLLYTSPSPRDS